MPDIKKYILSWNSLGKIGRSKLVSLTMFVPIIGYMVLFNKEVVELINLSAEILPLSYFGFGDFNVSSSERLFFIYYGLMFLGLGSILFILFSPSLLKENFAPSSYVKSESHLFTRKHVGNIIDKLLTLVEEEGDVYKQINQLNTRFNLILLQKKDEAEESDEYKRAVKDLMFLEWEIMNKLSCGTRVFSMVFYGLGFLSLSYPSLITFWAVTKAVFA
jgi:hypothetical protein